MKTKIKVLQSDIINGKQGDAANCMVARVVKRMVKKLYIDNITVSYDVGSFDKRTISNGVIDIDVTDISIPKRATQKIAKFDESKEDLKPFSFIVDIPAEYLKCNKSNNKSNNKKKTNETT